MVSIKKTNSKIVINSNSLSNNVYRAEKNVIKNIKNILQNIFLTNIDNGREIMLIYICCWRN